jgi:arylsulfatase A
MGDNGTGSGQADRSTIGGKPLSGSKGTMQEGGGLVPMIANWPGTIAPGAVNANLIDSTDFLPTFAELSGGQLPVDRVFDGRSFLPQLRGQAGPPRPWIFNQLASMWYVREADWKLNQAGELFDMRQAPFLETLVPTDSPDPLASAARTRLVGALAQLNPGGGIPDTGDGTGRHANKAKKKKGTDR